MKQILLLAAVAFAVISASPTSNQFRNIKTADRDSRAALPFNFHEAIALLNQQAVVGGNGVNYKDKVALLKKMLKREIAMPQAIKEVSATQSEAVNEPKADMLRKVQSRISQFKTKSPESFKKPEVSEAKKNFKTPEAFRIPETIKLPEKFQKQL